MELYNNVDPSTTNVLLCMKPISSKIENIFSVSFTREMVHDNASLADIGRQMRHTAQVDRNPMQGSTNAKGFGTRGQDYFFIYNHL